MNNKNKNTKDEEKKIYLDDYYSKAFIKKLFS